MQGALKIPRTKFQAVYVQAKNKNLVYIMGGKKFDGSRTNSIEVLDPMTGQV